MKQYFDYMKTFSIKEKLLSSLSFLAFIYELFIAAALIVLYCGFEDIFRASEVYSVLETPIIACAYFPLISVYIILFPVVYIIANVIFLHNRKFDVSIITFNFVFQLIHPATLVWAGYGLILLLNALNVIHLS